MITLLCYIIIFLAATILYLQSMNRILKKERIKKLQEIGKKDYRNIDDMIRYIIDKYIEEYERETTK